MEREELFILSGPSAEQLLAALRAELYVMTTTGNVALVVGDPEVFERFAALEGVYTGSELIRQGKSMPEGEWTDDELLATSAWLLRQSSEYQNEKKNRRGDGLRWNAPGFKPPGGLGP